MNIGQKARARFCCRFEKDRYLVTSESIIRNILIRVEPVELDKALQGWNEVYGEEDESLAIDGKMMCNAIFHIIFKNLIKNRKLWILPLVIMDVLKPVKFGQHRN